MRNLPLFLVKNSLAAKMIKRGIRNFCSSAASTSTMNQKRDDGNISCIAAPSQNGSHAEDSNIVGSPLSLEQMLLQLELEEAAARRSNMNDHEELLHRRMSCVNNADILRTARNALNQHPRFSLDGRDSMYRSTFRDDAVRGSFRCSDFRGRRCMDGYQIDEETSQARPSTVRGENVIWCKPGVVARLMGLDVLPVSIGNRHRTRKMNASPMDRQKQELRRMQRLEMESKLVARVLRMHGCKGRKMEVSGSPLAHDPCIMRPVPSRLQHARRGI